MDNKTANTTNSTALKARRAVAHNGYMQFKDIIDKGSQSIKENVLVEIINNELVEPDIIKKYLKAIEQKCVDNQSEKHPAFYKNVLDQFSDNNKIKKWLFEHYTNYIHPNQFIKQLRLSLANQNYNQYKKYAQLLQSHPEKEAASFSHLYTGMRKLFRSNGKKSEKGIQIIYKETPELFTEKITRKLFASWMEMQHNGCNLTDSIPYHLFLMLDEKNERLKKKLIRNTDLPETKKAALRL